MDSEHLAWKMVFCETTLNSTFKSSFFSHKEIYLSADSWRKDLVWYNVCLLSICFAPNIRRCKTKQNTKINRGVPSPWLKEYGRREAKQRVSIDLLLSSMAQNGTVSASKDMTRRNDVCRQEQRAGLRQLCLSELSLSKSWRQLVMTLADVAIGKYDSCLYSPWVIFTWYIMVGMQRKE